MDSSNHDQGIPIQSIPISDNKMMCDQINQLEKRLIDLEDSINDSDNIRIELMMDKIAKKLDANPKMHLPTMMKEIKKIYPLTQRVEIMEHKQNQLVTNK